MHLSARIRTLLRREPTAAARLHHHTFPHPHTHYRRLRVACPTSYTHLVQDN